MSSRRGVFPGRTGARLVVSALAAMFLAACSYSYVDAEGTRHVMGLVSLEMRPNEDNETIAGEVMEVRAVGLSVYSNPETTSLTLGYSHIVSGQLRNNVLVLGDPVAALRVPYQTGTAGETVDE